MPDKSRKQVTDSTLVQIAEKFLYASRKEGYDTMAAALDDDAENHNVALPMVGGSYRGVRILCRGVSRPDAGSDIEIHRIGAEGASAAIVRTEATKHGPLDYTDQYQEVLDRGGDLGAFWSPPFHLCIWTARRRTYGCAYVLDPPHDASSTADREAQYVA